MASGRFDLSYRRLSYLLLKIIQPAMQHIVETMEKAYGI